MASTLTQWTLAAETKEWVGPITVTVDGDPVDAFEVAVTVGSGRPSVWTSPTVIDDASGVLVGVGTAVALAPFKTYTVWVRYTDTPEVPVSKCGEIKVY